MLSNLKSLNIQPVGPSAIVVDDGVADNKMTPIPLAVLEALVFLSDEHTSLDLNAGLEDLDLRTSYDELTALSDVVSKHGLSRAILALADAKGHLSANIAAIPSLENLKADRSVSKSADIVAALEATKGEVVKLRLQRFKLRLGNNLKSVVGLAKWMTATDARLKVIANELKSGKREWDLEIADKREFHLYKFADIKKWVAEVEKAEAFMKAHETFHAPMNSKDYDIWLEEYRKGFNAVSISSEMDVRGEINYKKGENSLREDHESTAAAGGYTGIAQFDELYTDYRNMMSAVKSVFNPVFSKMSDMYDDFDTAMSTQDEHGQFVISGHAADLLKYGYHSSYIASEATWCIFKEVDLLATRVIPRMAKMIYMCTSKKTD